MLRDASISDPVSSSPDSPPQSEPPQPISNESDHQPEDADDVSQEPLPDEGVEQEPGEPIGWTCAASPPMAPCLNPLEPQVYLVEEDAEELDQPAELELSTAVSRYLFTTNETVTKNSVVFFYHNNSLEPNKTTFNGPVIERVKHPHTSRSQ